MGTVARSKLGYAEEDARSHQSPQLHLYTTEEMVEIGFDVAVLPLKARLVVSMNGLEVDFPAENAFGMGGNAFEIIAWPHPTIRRVERVGQF